MKQQLYLLAEGDFQLLLNKLHSIEANIKSTEEKSLADLWLDNEQLMKLLKVSRRTLQSWRDQGLVSFSQVGSKIYYKRKDVDAFLNKHVQKSFNE
jgi:hypothetical protein